MTTLTPVDFDPFESSAPTLTPVDHDPFATGATPKSGILDADSWLDTRAHQEGKKAFSEYVEGAKKLFDPQTAKEGPLQNVLQTAGGALSAIGVPLSYPFAAGASIISGAMAPGIRGVGEVINKFTPNPLPRQYTDDEIYEKINPDVNLSLAALGGRGFSPRINAPLAASTASEVGQAANRLTGAGLPVQVPRVVASESPLMQQTGMVARNIPIVGDPIVKKTERAIEQLGEAVTTTAQRQGGAAVEGAGDLASKSIKDWVGPKSKKIVDDAYNAVDRHVDPAIRNDLSNTRKTIADIVAQRQNARLQGDSKAVGEVLEGVQDPAGLNYQGVKDLRTHIGSMLDNSLLPADFKKAELKRIYGSLTEDLRDTVKVAGGPSAERMWERANKTNKAVQARREDLANIVGLKGDASAAEVFNRIKSAASSTTQADTKLLARARKAIGGDWEEVVSGVTGQLGLNAKGDFSPAIFVNNWQGKNGLSASGKALMYGNGAHRKALDDVARISHQVAVKLQTFANPSGTGRQTFGALGLTALWAEPMTAISTAIGGRLLAQVLASPAPAASLAHWMRAYSRIGGLNPRNMSALTIASRNLANTINSTLGTNISPAAFLKAIQGPVPARPEEE